MRAFKSIFESTVVTAIATYIEAGQIFADHALDYVTHAEMRRAIKHYSAEMGDPVFFDNQYMVAKSKGIAAASKFDETLWNPLSLKYLFEPYVDEAIHQLKQRSATFIARREFINL